MKARALIDRTNLETASKDTDATIAHQQYRVERVVGFECHITDISKSFRDRFRGLEANGLAFAKSLVKQSNDKRLTSLQSRTFRHLRLGLDFQPSDGELPRLIRLYAPFWLQVRPGLELSIQVVKVSGTVAGGKGRDHWIGQAIARVNIAKRIAERKENKQQAKQNQVAPVSAWCEVGQHSEDCSAGNFAKCRARLPPVNRLEVASEQLPIDERKGMYVPSTGPLAAGLLLLRVRYRKYFGEAAANSGRNTCSFE